MKLKTETTPGYYRTKAVLRKKTQSDPDRCVSASDQQRLTHCHFLRVTWLPNCVFLPLRGKAALPTCDHVFCHPVFPGKRSEEGDSYSLVFVLPVPRMTMCKMCVKCVAMSGCAGELNDPEDPILICTSLNNNWTSYLFATHYMTIKIILTWKKEKMIPVHHGQVNVIIK